MTVHSGQRSGGALSTALIPAENASSGDAWRSSGLVAGEL